MNQAQYSAYFMQAAFQARKAGYDVLLLGAEDAVSDIQRVTRGNLVDGVVLLDVMENDSRAAAADTFAKPSVAIGYPYVHEACACIDIDFTALGEIASRKLYDLGHRRVALLRSLEVNYQRGVGYMLLFRDSFLKHCVKLGITVIESEKLPSTLMLNALFMKLFWGLKRQQLSSARPMLTFSTLCLTPWVIWVCAFLKICQSSLAVLICKERCRAIRSVNCLSTLKGCVARLSRC